MAGNPYGMDFPMMKAIIEATDHSMTDMDLLDGQVRAHAEELAQHNQSTSGDTFVQGLAVWSEDFATIRGLLRDLNTDVCFWRDQGMRDQTDTEQSANSGKGYLG